MSDEAWPWRPVQPIPSPCSHYAGDDYRSRCKAEAEVWLMHPDGSPNPGGYVCRAHGEAIVSEYEEKLGEVWTLRVIERA